MRADLTTHRIVRKDGEAKAASFRMAFVTDCTPHQKWMAYNLFDSAKRVGQTEPITWIRSGCKDDEGKDDLVMTKKMYPAADLQDSRGGKAGENFNLGFGVPKAVHSFFQANEKMSNDTVLALIEADMTFLKRLRIDNLDTHGMPAEGHSLVQTENKQYVGGLRGVAQHYLCCDDLGPPYILAAKGWRELAPVWSQMVSKPGDGWGADQVAFAAAAKQAKVSFNVFDHFMVSDLVAGEGWSLVQEGLKQPAGDPCKTSLVEMTKQVDKLPTFMHVVRPWTVHEGNSTSLAQSWGFSKYQVPPGWHAPTKTDGILECGMPMFAMPHADLIETAAGGAMEEHGQGTSFSEVANAQKILDAKHSGWAMCTVLGSLNHMLTNYKEIKCPAGFNKAKALKMNVPLDWSAVLLDGAAEGAPKGTDLEWMKNCATKPAC